MAMTIPGESDKMKEYITTLQVVMDMVDSIHYWEPPMVKARELLKNMTNHEEPIRSFTRKELIKEAKLWAKNTYGKEDCYYERFGMLVDFVTEITTEHNPQWLPMPTTDHYRLVLGNNELAQVYPAPDHIDGGWWGIMDDYLEHSPTKENAQKKIEQRILNGIEQYGQT